MIASNFNSSTLEYTQFVHTRTWTKTREDILRYRIVSIIQNIASNQSKTLHYLIMILWYNDFFGDDGVLREKEWLLLIFI